MKVLFTNPPWWGDKTVLVSESGAIVREQYIAGVRAGSRWPFTLPVQSKPDDFVWGDYTPYPFFMGYAATYVAKHADCEVVMRDSIALRESYSSYMSFLRHNAFDVIVIESATPSWDHDRELIRHIRARAPVAKIIVTGPIASIAKTVLEEVPVDAVIHGEYEKGVVRVIVGEEGEIPFDLLTKDEMNAAPFPYYDDESALRYYDGCPAGQRYPHAHVWSSRGCPYKCIFCVWPATMTGNDPDGTGRRTVRHYTPEYMEAFLGELIGRYGYRSIYFDDDTFNIGDKHVIGMCEVMRRLDVPWSAMCRADTIKDETWALMKESGCFGVKLGFESGNQHVVDKIVNKRLDLARAADVVRRLKTLGMTVHGTFTFGLPNETAAQMADTVAYIESLPFDSVQKSGCAEIEGTPLHTLSSVGHLAAYEAATISADYRRASDGAQKLRNMDAEAQSHGEMR